ncbi:hypothetical protein C6P40_004956, partial [Pichia californica]
YFIKNNLTDNNYITNLFFKELLNNFNYIINHKNDNKFNKILIDDSIKLINLIPKTENSKYVNITLDNYCSKSFRNLYLSTKFKSKKIFLYLIESHLKVNNFKFSFDISFHTSKSHPIHFKNYINYFNKSQMYKLYQGPLGYKLISHLSSISNWQLLIRTINEIKIKTQSDKETRLSWIIYYKSIKHLLDLNLNNSHLDKTTYLLILKYLIHQSLDSDLGPFKRWDILFKNLQSKIDSIFNSNHLINNNIYIWLNKLSLVRAKRKNESKFKLFNSIFDTTECYEVSEENDESNHITINNNN